MILSIDHGNKCIKTPRLVFPTGLRESDVEPKLGGGDVLKYRGKYYTVSKKRIPYKRDKTEDERFYILTLYCIAAELASIEANAQGELAGGIGNILSGDTVKEVIDVRLLIGLPPAHYASLYSKWEQFFCRKEVEDVAFNGRKYTVYISEAIAYPQAYAAVQTRRKDIESYPKSFVIDIGGYTADYLMMKNGETDLEEFDSLEKGVIKLYNAVRSRILADTDFPIDEADIDAILTGQNHQYDDNIVNIVMVAAQDFVNDLISLLRERDIDLRVSKALFVGGGAKLLKTQILRSHRIKHPIFIDSINANAEGFVLLYAADQLGG